MREQAARVICNANCNDKATVGTGKKGRKSRRAGFQCVKNKKHERLWNSPIIASAGKAASTGLFFTAKYTAFP